MSKHSHVLNDSGSYGILRAGKELIKISVTKKKKKLIPKSGILKPCLLLELDYILMKNDKVLLWAGASALGFDLTLSGT